jgi:hypothetical protein
LKLECDEALLNVAFNCNSRLCAMGIYNFFKSRFPPGVAAFLLTLATVGRRSLTAVFAHTE